MKIIVNADDLGIGEYENAATFEFMERGVVTSGTLLANGRALDDAIIKAREFSHCSFGVHLCLTEFTTCSRDENLSPIVDDAGEFKGNMREVSVTSQLQEAIYIEWCAQVDRLLKSGVSISHFDSHHHIHTVPKLFPVLKKLQQKYGVRKVRISKNIATSAHAIGGLLCLKKYAWNSALRLYYSTVTTRAFTSFAEFLELTKDGFPSFSSIELMVHPGSALFEAETAQLAGEWRDVLSKEDCLISYDEL